MTAGWHDERQAFVQHYESDVLDASVLLAPVVGFISSQDPRWLSTLDAIDEELVTDSLVYRYDPAASPDGLQGAEGTVSICTMWYVDAMARGGRVEKARVAFEKMLTYATVGLYSEEIAVNGEQMEAAAASTSTAPAVAGAGCATFDACGVGRGRSVDVAIPKWAVCTRVSRRVAPDLVVRRPASCHAPTRLRPP